MTYQETTRFDKRVKLLRMLSQMQLSLSMIKTVSTHLGSFKETSKIEAEAERLLKQFEKCKDQKAMEELILAL